MIPGQAGCVRLADLRTPSFACGDVFHLLPAPFAAFLHQILGYVDNTHVVRTGI
jgi:hypothetical protein